MSSREFFQKTNERTNSFIFTTMRRVFVRFLEEIKETKKTFRNYPNFSLTIFFWSPQSLFATSYFRHLFGQLLFQCLQLGCPSVQDDLLDKFQRPWLLCLIWRTLEPRWVCWYVLQLGGHGDFLWLTEKKRIDKNWYFVTKIIQTYCEKKKWNSRLKADNLQKLITNGHLISISWFGPKNQRNFCPNL